MDGDEIQEDVVSITPGNDAPPDKGGDQGVNDVDDLIDNPPDTTPEKKGEQASPSPADEGVKSVEAQLKELQDKTSAYESQTKKLEQANKGLLKDLYKERQAKKEASAKKDDGPPLTDAQLQQILDENPGDTATMLKVVAYKSAQAAKEAKGTALDEVAENNRAKVANDFLLSRYPALADETSEMRQEVEQVKERFGLTNHKMGDLFAVGIRVAEDLPKIIQGAYEKGKADAIAIAANKKREGDIKNGELTPRGKGKSDITSFSKTQADTANQMGLSKSQQAILATIKKGKAARSVVVED
jgi:hypothetical protein